MLLGLVPFLIRETMAACEIDRTSIGKMRFKDREHLFKNIDHVLKRSSAAAVHFKAFNWPSLRAQGSGQSLQLADFDSGLFRTQAVDSDADRRRRGPKPIIGLVQARKKCWISLL